MADILSIPECGGTTGQFNSGIPLCDVIRDIPLGIIGLDAGVGWNAAERASKSAFLTKLQTMIRADRGARAYPFFKLTNFDDKSKEPTKGALGNLTNGEITTNDGIPAFDFQHRIGEVFHKKLLQAQNAGLTWIIVDKKYVVYGTLDSSLFTGYSTAEFYVALAKFGTTSAASVYPFSITFANMAEWRENGGFIQLDSTVVSKTGIRDVALSLELLTSNVAKIKALGLGGVNMGTLFSVELASASAWVAKNAQTGATFTITSVAWDSTNSRFNVTLDSTLFTALASGDKVTVALASASALYALGIDGYESTGVVTVTKP